jgi:hypothetical protein
MQENLLSESSSPTWPSSAIGGPTTASELPTWARLTDDSGGSALPPSHLLPTPSAEESTPTDEYLAEVREHLDPEDPHHRLWLPGRKWMAQRTLSRTIPTLLPTPSASDSTGAEGETRRQRQKLGRTGGGHSETCLSSSRLLPTPNRGRREQHDEGERGVPVASEGSAPARLLPTPTAGDGDASGSRNLEGSNAHPGVSLTDAVQTGGSTESRLLPTPTAEDGERGVNADDARDGGPTLAGSLRLLPTPQAADGDGGRQEKGAMANAGQRPSGQKATLPLPTAVQMREDISKTPFAKPDEAEEQLVLLPTPVANDANPGSGGELRAAIVHGEGRRNETGVDTLGRPNEGRPSAKLLPTPTTQDAANTAGDSQRERNSDPLNVVAADMAKEPQLLPTPRVTSERNSRKAMVENDQWSSVSLAQATEIAAGILPREFKSWDEVPGEIGRDARARLLPTPTSHEDGRKSDEALRARGDGGQGSPPGLGQTVRERIGSDVEWGVYEAAVRRWEHVLDREAPAPTDEKGRLDPPFVEWMLGYPEGWFDLDGVSRTRKLRALGNSVQVQCAEAVGGWLTFLLDSGLLLDEPPHAA